MTLSQVLKMIQEMTIDEIVEWVNEADPEVLRQFTIDVLTTWNRKQGDAMSRQRNVANAIHQLLLGRARRTE